MRRSSEYLVIYWSQFRLQVDVTRNQVGQSKQNMIWYSNDSIWYTKNEISLFLCFMSGSDRAKKSPSAFSPCLGGCIGQWSEHIPNRFLHNTWSHEIHFFYIKTTRGWPEPKKLLKIFTSLRLEIAWLLLKISQYCQKTTEKWKMIIPVYSVLGWLLGLGFPSLKSCLIFLVSEHKLLVNWLLV